MAKVICPTVDITDARSLLVSAASRKAVLAGGPDTSILIDGHPYAVSSDHPVTVEVQFNGDPPDGQSVGGLVTLTLIADRITIEPAPEGLCMNSSHLGRTCPDGTDADAAGGE